MAFHEKCKCAWEEFNYCGPVNMFLFVGNKCSKQISTLFVQMFRDLEKHAIDPQYGEGGTDEPAHKRWRRSLPLNGAAFLSTFEWWWRGAALLLLRWVVRPFPLLSRWGNAFRPPLPISPSFIRVLLAPPPSLGGVMCCLIREG